MADGTYEVQNGNKSAGRTVTVTVRVRLGRGGQYASGTRLTSPIGHGFPRTECCWGEKGGSCTL